MAFVRRVRTASGATAVQIAEYAGGRQRIVAHVGSAHTDAELGVLLARARALLEPAGQQALEVDVEPTPPVAGLVSPLADPALFDTRAAGPVRRDGPGRVLGTDAGVVFEALASVFTDLGFDALGDAVFRDLVIARIVEPTSLLDCGRVLTDLGRRPASYATMKRTLTRAGPNGDYRDRIASACFTHAAASGDITLCLYDVTTLYFEAEKEDDLRKVGYSKERRVDPQIIVGLLVDRGGFPLEIGCWEGNKAETATMIPIIRQFQDRHSIEAMVVVADAGMLSAGNLKDLHEAGLRFIVGSRVTKAPADLASHFRWHGDAFTDAQVIDTITPRVATTAARGVNDEKKRAEPVWDPTVHERSWRAVWAYSAKRAARDAKTLTLQENRARAVIAGEKAARTPRFVTVKNGSRSLDETSLARARRVVGLKGYVTNIPATMMPAGEVIASYHELWHVEASFRMSKSDLRARPIFHHTRDAIEAHLTIVFAALAVARYLQDTTGMSIKKIVNTLRPLQQVTVRIAGHEHLAQDPLTPTAETILDALNHSAQ